MEQYRNIWLKPTNPLIDFANKDLGGNKTLPRKSAMDRVSIRRLLIYVEKSIRAFWEKMLNETPSDEWCIEPVCDYASELMEYVKSSGGCKDYNVIGHYNSPWRDTIDVKILSLGDQWITLAMKLEE